MGEGWAGQSYTRGSTTARRARRCGVLAESASKSKAVSRHGAHTKIRKGTAADAAAAAAADSVDEEGIAVGGIGCLRPPALDLPGRRRWGTTPPQSPLPPLPPRVPRSNTMMIRMPPLPQSEAPRRTILPRQLARSCGPWLSSTVPSRSAGRPFRTWRIESHRATRGSCAASWARSLLWLGSTWAADDRDLGDAHSSSSSSSWSDASAASPAIPSRWPCPTRIRHRDSWDACLSSSSAFLCPAWNAETLSASRRSRPEEGRGLGGGRRARPTAEGQAAARVSPTGRR
jgi:hypothetical protein